MTVSVTSAAGGRAELEVSTLVGPPELPDVPFAGNATGAIEYTPTANANGR